MVQLTFDLLDELAARWRAAGAAIADALRPGLSDEEAVALAQQLGCTLPPEARTWWSWHNGSAGNTVAYEAWPGMWLNSLEASVETSLWERNEAVSLAEYTAAQSAGGDVQPYWHSAWLPILTTGGGDHVVIHCEEQGPMSPVYAFERERGGPLDTAPRAPSIGTVVTWWIDGIDTGACWWNGDRRMWMRDPQRLDPDSSRGILV